MGSISNRAVYWRIASIVALVSAVSFGYSRLLSSSSIRYLENYENVSWIAYPSPVSSEAYDSRVEQTTVFVRRFRITDQVKAATLEVRSFSHHKVRFNQKVLKTVASDHRVQKSPAIYNVTENVQLGDNELSIEVVNSHGPPAVWSKLLVGNVRIPSDRAWTCSRQGAVELPATPAEAWPEIRTGNLLSVPEKVGKRVAGIVWTSTMLSLVVASVAILLRKLYSAKYFCAFRQRTVLLITVIFIVVYASIGAINFQTLHYPMGHDVEGHIEYLRLIAAGTYAPLAHQSWQAHHPPVYYLLTCLHLACWVYVRLSSILQLV